MLEATCGACGATFIPADEADLVHLMRDDGQPCGGLGQIMGEWVFTPTTSSPERCEESRPGWCDTHGSRWVLERPQCRHADALGMDPWGQA